MRIHWFPGHMAKAVRMMRDEAKNVDSVVYVLDARAPASCLNDAFEPVIGSKTRLYVLNKADLVARNEVIKWTEHFKKQGMECIYTDSLSKKDAPAIIAKTAVPKGCSSFKNPSSQPCKTPSCHLRLRAFRSGFPANVVYHTTAHNSTV